MICWWRVGMAICGMAAVGVVLLWAMMVLSAFWPILFPVRDRGMRRREFP